MVDVVIKNKPVAQVEPDVVGVGDEVVTAHSSMDGLAAATAPFTPQVMDLSEAVRFDDPMELEAFMHDRILIEVHPKSPVNDETPELFIHFTCREDLKQTVMLGATQEVGRWCVEQMARCRDASVQATAQPISTSSLAHEYKQDTRFNSKTLKYPFTVLRDPRGQLGYRWFHQILRDRV